MRASRLDFFNIQYANCGALNHIFQHTCARCGHVGWCSWHSASLGTYHKKLQHSCNRAATERGTAVGTLYRLAHITKMISLFNFFPFWISTLLLVFLNSFHTVFDTVARPSFLCADNRADNRKAVAKLWQAAARPPSSRCG